MGSTVEVILLTSGGIDSTALLDLYLRRTAKVNCVYFQYDQPSAKSEKAAVVEVSKYYNVRSTIINLSFPIALRKEELIGRNALFVLAASSLKPPPLRIALGIHSGSRHYDCTRSFVDDYQRVLDGYFAGTVRLEAPFIDLEKIDVIDYCRANNVPIDLTYSCQRQNYPPCGKCSSCLDRGKFCES